MVDCTTMRLQGRAEARNRAYRGAGHIGQQGISRLEMTLYDPTYEVGHEDLARQLPEAGVWVPESHFYDLEGSDLSGRTWRGEWINPDTSARFGAPGIVMRARCREVVSRSDDRSPGHWLRVYVPGEFQIPTNAATATVTTAAGRMARQMTRNIWVVEGLPHQLLITRTDAGLEIEAQQDDREFPRGFDSRLEEALWLLLAEPVQWLTLEERGPRGSRVSIRPVQPVAGRPRLRPPIEAHHLQAIGDASRLLGAYLAFIQGHDQERYHPISVAVRNALRAARGRSRMRLWH